RQGLFDMPTFIKTTKDNKKLHEKTTFCLKISLKLMDVWRHPYMYKNILKLLYLHYTKYKHSLFSTL
ncbi:hypothetical protein ACTFSP_30940, partial [Bacillus cereus group sp. MYBK108-2]|uniref:hypothetical protein n=1 Tax=unclassified Bacillus cereus group TaxID=2750818 RepID=UPI003F7B1C36